MKKIKLNIQYFSSTNHTQYYDLSQYTANDKPTYLIDYNGDMLKIDTALYNATQKGLENESAIGTLSNLNTTAKSNLVSAINEVNTKTDGIGNLSNLTTTANNNLVSAINEVDSEADTNTASIGTLANLETTNKSNLVGAINEVNSNVGNLSNLNTTNKNNLVSAINEVKSEVEGTVLYNGNGTGTTGNITLSDNISNYDIIKVVFGGSTVAEEEIEYIVNKTNNINFTIFRAFVSGVLFFYCTNYNITNTQLTIGEFSRGPYNNQTTDANFIYIYEIIGYNRI